MVSVYEEVIITEDMPLKSHIQEEKKITIMHG
jgi:hypothetical protein